MKKFLIEHINLKLYSQREPVWMQRILRLMTSLLLEANIEKRNGCHLVPAVTMDGLSKGIGVSYV